MIMPEPTLESLARRLEEVERRLDERPASVLTATKDWRSVVGISERTEFPRVMQAEMDAIRDADRRLAESENGPRS